jgi:hypothetical protein
MSFHHRRIPQEGGTDKGLGSGQRSGRRPPRATRSTPQPLVSNFSMRVDYMYLLKCFPPRAGHYEAL